MNTNWLTKIVLSDRTQHLSNKYSLPIEEVQNLLQYDPTKGKCLEWITKNYKSNQLRFPEDGNKTIETLTTFTKLHPVLKRNNVPIDINLYSYSDLVRLIEQYGEQKSKREQYRINEVEGVKELLNFPPYKAVQILTPEASAKLCRGTEWCVKDPAFFEGYSDNLIMVLKNGKPYYLVHERSKQYKNEYDEGLLSQNRYNTEALETLRTLNISGVVKEPIDGDFGFEMLKLLPQNQILTSSKLSYFYARYILEDRFELGEKSISESAEFSFSYAQYVLNDRFELGESTISKNIYWAYMYAKHVIEGRFELGEASIANNAEYSYYYAKYVLNGRFELGELAIATNAEWSGEYATNVLRNEFKLGEPVIATSAQWSYYYATNVIGGRFELGEAAIATDPQYSYDYAQGILNDRFELGEKSICLSPYRALLYAEKILKGRFELGEESIATDPEYSYNYALYVLGGRFELGEYAIATNAKQAYHYAVVVLKGRFELGEKTILNSSYKQEYLNFLRKNSIEI